MWAGKKLIEDIIVPRLAAGGSLRATDANCWAKDLIECAPRGSTNGSLITPSVMSFAKHFSQDGPTATRIFKRASDGVEYRRCTNGPRADISTIDMTLIGVNQPTPVRMPRILPSNWSTIIESNGSGLLAVVLDMSDEWTIHRVSYLNSGGQFRLNRILSTNTTDPLSKYANYSQPMVVGDSSSPAFLVLPNQVIFLGCISTSDQATRCNGHAAHYHYDNIVNALATMKINEKPLLADLVNLTGNLGDKIPQQLVAEKMPKLFSLAEQWKNKVIASGKTPPKIVSTGYRVKNKIDDIQKFITDCKGMLGV